MKKIYLLALTAVCSINFGSKAIAQNANSASDTSIAAPAAPAVPAHAPVNNNIKVPGPEKKYLISLTAQELTLLSQVIDASTSPHVTVMGISKVINDQLMPQVQQTQTHEAPKNPENSTPQPAAASERSKKKK